MSESRADLSLAAALRVLAPMVELMLREGVTYPRFANALKTTFLESATSLLEESSARVNDSRISALTGIHRKDVREWRSVGQPRPQAKTLGAAMEVFTRWANDPEYCDKKGQPRVLDRAGGPGSFEALAVSISNDVHPHTLLQELIRLGVARRAEATANGENDKVSLCLEAFVPKEGTAELLRLFSDNVGDHLAAAVHNLTDSGTPMLEQSVFADNLRPESVVAMNKLARQIWSSAFHEIVRNATVLSDQDRGQSDADQRIRIGMYFYHGPNLKP
ncbi:MAG: hypothetical protein IPP88_02510 [Betaproteobacteria bacterium]|nr:hypothetical protein [Betaproteobacteria bacterium]